MPVLGPKTAIAMSATAGTRMDMEQWAKIAFCAAETLKPPNPKPTPFKPLNFLNLKP